METAPFSDPNPGDTHFCTDWEIWTLVPLQRVWVTSCITGVERLHTHLADGTFENSHAGRTSLFFDTSYKLQVRHRDNTGLWSAWAELPFSTGSQAQVFPLIAADVGAGPTWQDEAGASIILPAGAPPGNLRLESGTGTLLLQFTGFDGVTNTITNPPALAGDVAVRVVITAGGVTLALPPSRVGFTDNVGNIRTIYLPAVSVPASGQAYYWVSNGGSTYVGSAGQTAPDFSTLARGSPVPWAILQPGYEVEIVATGFQLPVNIAFVPNGGPNPTDPYYYVTELYGTIKVVQRDGTVSDYATNLLNFDPTGEFPGSGEQGVSGIAVDPASGDVFATMLYDSAPPNGPHYPKIVRFHSTDGGRTAATQTVILTMPGEEQGQSHFISNISIGPDGKLYVHMGDGFVASTALDMDSFRGKILRMNMDGTAPTDNPFYNAVGGINSRDYIFAYGFRNPFGGCWRASDAKHYEVENGLTANDRFAKVTAGTSYGWDGSDPSMTTHAIYNWVETHAPVNIAFVEPQAFGGSLFPAAKQDHAFVTESGSTYAQGPGNKRIVEFVLNESGTLVSGPTTIVEYSGTGYGTAVGLAAGPDGLYFTDLYKDQDATTPIDPGANVLRLRYKGIANLTASVLSGSSPLAVAFTDLSSVPGATAWLWDFGDGSTSTAQNPSHLYGSEGVYDVSLAVTGSNGTVFIEKSDYISVGTSGLTGAYYQGVTLTSLILSRADATVDFNWGLASPDPAIPEDGYSVRWTGYVQPQFTETYRFFTNTDDGARLWVNNQLIIDHFIDQAATEWFGDIALVGTQWYPITMEYYENGGLAEAHLSWQSPGTPKQTIPWSRLRRTLPPTSIDVPSPAAIQRATLFPSYPNPFRRQAQISFAVPRSGRVTLRIFDVHGAVVVTLFDAVAQGQRVYRIPFEARTLAAGVYFQRLEVEGARVSRKVVLLH